MFTWKEPDYNLITTEDQLDFLVEKLKFHIKENKPISLDIETTASAPRSALNPFVGWLLGIAFSFGVDEGYYIPISHTKDGMPLKDQIPLPIIVEKLNPVLSSGGTYILHNAKFDYKYLWRAGIYLFPNMWDTMNALKLIYGDARQSTRLKQIIKQFVNIPESKILSFNEASEGNQAEADLHTFATYAINDVIYTYYVYMSTKPQIDAIYSKLFYEAETKLIPILAHMELRGVQIDKNYYENIRIPLNKCKDKIETAFLNRYNINVGSPLQVGELIQNICDQKRKHVYFDRSQKTNNIKTDVEALQRIQRETQRTDELHKIAKHVLFHRGINKALNTYIDKYPTVCQKYYNGDKEIYILNTVFNQIINSGRLSSSPNVQNITRDSAILSVRKGFVARPGYKFIEADWSGCELRIVAIVSQEEKILNAFLEDPLNADLHTLTAQQIFEKDVVSKDERHIGKTINFSILYGATAISISKTLNCEKEDAMRYLNAFYKSYPGILTWQRDTENMIKEKGYSETLYGRRRLLPIDVYPDMREKYLWFRAVRELTNHIIQGTNADLLKFSLVNITKEFAEKGLEAYPLTTTHDSIIVEAKEEVAEQALAIMKNVMEVKIKKVLFPVDAEIKSTFAKE